MQKMWWRLLLSSCPAIPWPMWRRLSFSLGLFISGFTVSSSWSLILGLITVLPWTLRADVIENSFVALHFPRPNIRLGVGLVDPNLARVDECDAHEITSTTTLRQIKKFMHKRQIFNIVRHRIIRFGRVRHV